MRRLFDHRNTAFTIVEILVSVTVLAILVAVVSQLTNAAAGTIMGSRKHLDADSQARMVFDRMAIDFERMVRRKDVDSIFSKQNGNDKMFFYSEAAVYSGTTTAAARNTIGLVGYRINTGYQLERLGKALTWEGAGNAPGSVVFLTFNGGATTPDPKSTLAGNWSAAIGNPPAYNGSDTGYHVAAETVYRLEFCFQVKDLTNPNIPGAAYSNYPVACFGAGATNQGSASATAPAGPKVGDRWFDNVNNRAFVCTGTATGGNTWQSNGMDDVLGIVVAIGVLDNTSRKIVADPATGAIQSSAGTALVEAFQDSTDADLKSSPPKLPAEAWQTALDTQGFANNAGIPQSTAAQIRIYQRCFCIGQN